MKWKLLRLTEQPDNGEHYKKCEHHWELETSHGDLANTYLEYYCHGCDKGIDIELDIEHAAGPYYSGEIESEVSVCKHCGNSAGDCECYICPECKQVDTDSDEDYGCENCVCDWCEEANGCEILKCTKCSDEFACETLATDTCDEWVTAKLCEGCFHDSQMTDEEKRIKRALLRDKARALLIQANSLHETEADE
jgi:hypothetical protein